MRCAGAGWRAVSFMVSVALYLCKSELAHQYGSVLLGWMQPYALPLGDSLFPKGREYLLNISLLKHRIFNGPPLHSVWAVSYEEHCGIPHSFLGKNSLWVFLNLLVDSLGLHWILEKTRAWSHPTWGCKVVRSHTFSIVLGSGQDLDRRTPKKKRREKKS